MCVDCLLRVLTGMGIGLSGIQIVFCRMIEAELFAVIWHGTRVELFSPMEAHKCQFAIKSRSASPRHWQLSRTRFAFVMRSWLWASAVNSWDTSGLSITLPYISIYLFVRSRCSCAACPNAGLPSGRPVQSKIQREDRSQRNVTLSPIPLTNSLMT